MIIHFSSVHALIKTFNAGAMKMRFAKLLRNLNGLSKNDPYWMRPVEGLIRTVRVVPAIHEGSGRIWATPRLRYATAWPGLGEYPAGSVNP
jgi:hypothetical protein